MPQLIAAEIPAAAPNAGREPCAALSRTSLVGPEDEEAGNERLAGASAGAGWHWTPPSLPTGSRAWW